MRVASPGEWINQDIDGLKQWINPEKRLPESGEIMLFAATPKYDWEDPERKKGIWVAIGECLRLNDEPSVFIDFEDSKNYKIDEVIAWMRIPYWPKNRQEIR